VKGPDGGVIRVVVTHISENAVTLDANPPLAGETLIFDLEVVEFVWFKNIRSSCSKKTVTSPGLRRFIGLYVDGLFSSGGFLYFKRYGITLL